MCRPSGPFYLIDLTPGPHGPGRGCVDPPGLSRSQRLLPSTQREILPSSMHTPWAGSNRYKISELMPSTAEKLPSGDSLSRPLFRRFNEPRSETSPALRLLIDSLPHLIRTLWLRATRRESPPLIIKPFPARTCMAWFVALFSLSGLIRHPSWKLEAKPPCKISGLLDRANVDTSLSQLLPAFCSNEYLCLVKSLLPGGPQSLCDD